MFASGEMPALRRWMRALCACLALGALVLAVGACGDDGDSSGGSGSAKTSAGQADKPVRVAFLAAATGVSFVDEAVRSAQAEAKAEGATLKVFDAKFDPQKQFAECQDAISQGFDAIVVLASSGPPMIPCATAAEDAGIPLTAHQTAIGNDLTTPDPTTPGVTGQVLTPIADSVQATIDEMVKACEDRDPCNVAVMRVTRLLPFEDALIARDVDAAVEQHDNIKIVAQADGGLAPDTGIAAMQNMLQREQDVDVVVGVGSQSMVGAENALKSAGKQLDARDGVRIVSGGGTEYAVRKVRDGAWYATILTGLPRTEAKLATQMAIKAARGQDIGEAGVIPTEVLGVPLSMDVTNVDRYPQFNGEFYQ